MTANPSLAQEHFERAEALFHAGSYPQALHHYREAGELDPTLWKAALFMGDCAFKLGQFFIALEFFHEVLLARPQEYGALRFAGDCYLRLGRPLIAIRYFEKALAQARPHAPVIEEMHKANRARPSMEAFFADRVVARDTWVNLLEHVRFGNLLVDLRATTEQSWPSIFAFYREYLQPDRLQRLEAEQEKFRSAARAPGAQSNDAEAVRARNEAQRQLDRLIETIKSLAAAGRVGGPPQMYRFGGADAAVAPTIAQLLERLGERRGLIDEPRAGPEAEVTRLRIEGIDWLSSILRTLPAERPANCAAAELPAQIWQAVAQRNYELAMARAFGEHELMMSFKQPGPAESETYPAGEGESEGNADFDISAAARAIEEAPDPESARRAVAQAGWHAEAILYAMAMGPGPSMYLHFAADYRHAYDLAHKLVAVSSLVPERLNRFQLCAFYRLQFLVPLQEAAAKLGLHEETIEVGDRILDTIAAMGPFWQLDLPKWPGIMLRLQTAQLPEVYAARACDLTAQAYRQLGDETKAGAYWVTAHQVAARSEAASDAFGAKDARDLSEQLHQSGAPDGALKYAKLALALDPRKYRDASIQFSVNRALGSLAADLRLPRMHVLYALRAFAGAVEMGMPFNILYCYHQIGLALEQQADTRGADYFYRKALAQIDSVGMDRKASMATTRAGIATLLHLALLVKTDDPGEAEQLLLRAIEIVEQQRQMIDEDLNAAGFGHAGSEIYAALIDLSLEPRRDNKRAFEMLERSKIRALLDQFAKRGSAEQDARPPATLHRGSGGFASFMTEKRTTLFELYWHDGYLRTFVVRPGCDIEVLALPLSRGRLGSYVQSFQAAFHDGDPYQQESGAWNELSTTWLEGQLGTFIDGSDRIVFVPHSSFHHLPLHLLSYKGKPLGVQRPVTYCPSATLLVGCRKRNRIRRERGRAPRMLSIGVDFEEEAVKVSKAAAGFSLWVGSRGQVDKPKVLAGLSEHDLVHFSCHGVFDLEQPMESGLFLDRVGNRDLGLTALRGEPNFLAAREIAECSVDGALVTLSACETAQAQNRPGDEILGLTRALFLAGAGAVVVSFWRVPADATMDFMSTFYETLFAGGVSVADAMQARYDRTAANYRDPAMWGGFAVMGDGLSPWISH